MIRHAFVRDIVHRTAKHFGQHALHHAAHDGNLRGVQGGESAKIRAASRCRDDESLHNRHNPACAHGFDTEHVPTHEGEQFVDHEARDRCNQHGSEGMGGGAGNASVVKALWEVTMHQVVDDGHHHNVAQGDTAAHHRHPIARREQVDAAQNNNDLHCVLRQCVPEGRAPVLERIERAFQHEDCACRHVRHAHHHERHAHEVHLVGLHGGQQGGGDLHRLHQVGNREECDDEGEVAQGG